VQEIQTRATIVQTYDERQVVIPNADLFTHSVIVNTALSSRRWQYDLNMKNNSGLDDLKKKIVCGVRKVPGVLPEPAPEALRVDVAPDAAKIRVLWSTQDPRQHQVLASYDQVLTVLSETLETTVDEGRQRPAA
jgi:small conductance mechanosensitive channel